VPKVPGAVFGQWCGQGFRRLIELLLEQGNDLVFIQPERAGVLSQKTASQKAARKSVEMVIFHCLKKVGADLRLGCNLF
jgi:hypothetical protein